MKILKILLLITLFFMAACSSTANIQTVGEETSPIDNALKVGSACYRYSVPEGGSINRKNFPNEKHRALIYHCGELGFLPTINAKAHTINTDSTEHNALGKALEKTNIWFFTEDVPGIQDVGISLFNYTPETVSWIVVGFNSGRCHEQREWESAMRVELAEPLPARRQAIIKWINPLEVTFTGEGCMDVLAAGS